MGFLTGGTPAGTGRMNVPGTAMGYDMHRIPIIGNMFPNPADEFKQAQMNAMNQQSQALQPTNNALAAMYGAGATQGFQATNPFGPSAFV